MIGSSEVLVLVTSVWKGELYEAQVVRELEIWGKDASASGGVRAAIRSPTLYHLLYHHAAGFTAMSVRVKGWESILPKALQ